MSSLKNIAVIDVGKTNAKLALVDTQTLTERAVVTRPNKVLAGLPYPHFDLEGHWAFFLTHLKSFHESHGVDAISITTHGASAVLLASNGTLATPMLDYEHSGPDDLSEAYDAIRPSFEETGSTRLLGGLNVGAQLHWLFAEDSSLYDRTAHVMTYPQYWAFRLTGEIACDVTSLGCHTDLWNPWKGCPSSLVDELGLSAKLAPAHKSSDILGTPLPEVIAATGLASETPVVCGIHDSNASLVPHLLGKEKSFSVISTGTWVVSLAIGGKEIDLDPSRDTLVNVNAYGAPVPSARFMGGREYELVRDGSTAEPDASDRVAVLSGNIMLLPAVVSGSGPFAGNKSHWTNTPQSEGQRIYALSLYLALMTNTCLDLIGGQGSTIVEGPFARNLDYLEMLSVLRTEAVKTASSATGTSIGAALLLSEQRENIVSSVSQPSNEKALREYAQLWLRLADVDARGMGIA